MKLLLVCVNSPVSFLGYDWEKGKIFWSSPASTMKVCSACYDGEELLVASGNSVTRLSANGSTELELSGEHGALAHSIHLIEGGGFGVVDTGNSQIVAYERNGDLRWRFSPLDLWDNLPSDAVHLNDFAVTPHGILASCFGYRPWRKLLSRMTWDEWCSGGFGLLLNLSGNDSKGSGRISGCGFNHPHSLLYRDDHLYLCSAGTGDFHVCGVDTMGFVHRKREYHVTDDHFLRGALKSAGNWYLGGSSKRHGLPGDPSPVPMAIYKLDETTGAVAMKDVGFVGEVYDILPWHPEILAPIFKQNIRD